MEEELGVPWEDVFATIEPEPLAAGTIGQVHRAVLDNGERVVVKVQRPTAAEDIGRDLSLLELFAKKTGNRDALRKIVDLPAAIEHLSDSLRRELDFELEAQNVERLRSALTAFPRLDAPRVYQELSTSRLLVLEEIPACPCARSPRGRPAARRPASCSSATTSRSSSRASSTPTRTPGTCSGPTRRSSSSTSAWLASSRRRCAASYCCSCSRSGRRTCRS